MKGKRVGGWGFAFCKIVHPLAKTIYARCTRETEKWIFSKRVRIVKGEEKRECRRRRRY